MQQAFTTIYENDIWGNNDNPDYTGSSGPGSTLENNRRSYIPFLKNFIIKNRIKRVVDLGCGDFICGPYIYGNLPITSYTGYDAYEKVIEHNIKTHSPPKYNFVHSDFFSNKEQIVGADLCILKDVLMHWPLKEITTFLDYLVASKKFKYILLNNCAEQKTNNTDILVGSHRPLSCDFLPLKKYKPKKLYCYMSNVPKEVSVIVCPT
jgi:hypothetical protein